MSKLVKIGTYLTQENDEMWRKACYLLNGKKKDVINKALSIGLKHILKEIEDKEEKK